MRVLIVALVSVLIALAIFFIVRSHIQGNFPTTFSEDPELSKYGRKFLKALSCKDGNQIHQMFNETFQKEISQTKVQNAIDRWYERRTFEHVKIGIVRKVGLAGFITTWISFKKTIGEKFVYQYWIKTDDGLKLMWLSGILNHRDFMYGISDTSTVKKLMQLMMETAVSDSGIEEIFPQIDLVNTLVILRHPAQNFVNINLPKNQSFWLTVDELKNNYKRLGINTFFDFGVIRVMNDIAVGAIDIVPIASAIPPPKITRRRSIEMFFKKIDSKWVFAGYGSKW